MGVKGKNRSGENYEAFGNEWKTKPSRIRGCMEGFTHRLCRPLRIFQFLATLLLFAMTVYMTAMQFRHLTDLASILLIILTSAYLFFMAIDMISQFEAHELPDAPMFLFSLLGMMFFAIAGALLIQYAAADTFWALILAKILCFIVSLLFLMEVTMLLTSWRQRCVSWTKCYPYTPSRDCGRLMLFPGDDTCGIDVEVGRADATTSVSNNEIPMEDFDMAVAKHGHRRISVGHRRQYVDRDSSAPAFSTVHIAEIQTDTERTTITECQTQRTETKEMVIQTNSRCELCNRQMDDRPESPTKLPTQCACVASRSQRSPSPRLSSVPDTDQDVLALGRIRSNLPTPNTPDPHIQQSPCIVCPAFLQMMREGMASPCCKSCNCEAGKHRPGRVPEPASETCNSQMQSPRWSQREPQRTPKSSSTAKQTGNESPSTNNDRSDAERSDLIIEEGNRRWPSKKISRVYETRPCPTHGSGLAARMSGLPETVTKVTLSSICVRRNKRTQTPNKDSLASGEKGNNGVNEDIPKEKTIEGKSFGYEDTSENRRSHEEQRPPSRSEDTNERPSEDRIKLRLSSCATPRKLYRNSEPITQLKESATTPTDCCSGNKCQVVSKKEEKIRSPRATSWKSDGTDKEKSTEIGEIEHRSIMSEKSPMKEEAIEEAAFAKTSKFRTPIKEETIHDADVEGPKTSNLWRPMKDAEITGPRTSKVRRSADKDESATSSTTASEKKSAGSASVIDPKESIAVSGPVLRLRLETSLDPSTIPDPASNAVASLRASVSASRTTLRSRSRGLPSIPGSEILSNNREDDVRHNRIGCVRPESSGVWRSLTSKESLTPREKTENRREYLRGEGKTVGGDPRASATSRDNDKTGYESSWDEEETDDK